MTKEICKLKKVLKKDFELIARLVDAPRFLCTDCGRAANEKQRLCEPKRLHRKGARAGIAVAP